MQHAHEFHYVLGFKLELDIVACKLFEIVSQVREKDYTPDGRWKRMWLQVVVVGREREKVVWTWVLRSILARRGDVLFVFGAVEAPAWLAGGHAPLGDGAAPAAAAAAA